MGINTYCSGAITGQCEGENGRGGEGGEWERGRKGERVNGRGGVWLSSPEIGLQKK
jgi:hypothetical protein